MEESGWLAGEAPQERWCPDGGSEKELAAGRRRGLLQAVVAPCFREHSGRDRRAESRLAEVGQ